MSRPIGIDLFAGAGGLSLGFEQAGFDVMAAVEIDPIHAAVHKFNFPDCAVMPQSIREVNGEAIRKAANLGKKSVDIVFGGPPCQGFSLIGQRALDDPRNSLVRDFVRIVDELQPRYFLFENVKGLTVGKQKAFLDEILSAFQAIDYSVALPWRVLNAADYGVPQFRERLFLLGARKGETLPSYPEKTHTRPDLPRNGLPPTPTCEEALADLPDADQFYALRSVDEVKTSEWGKAGDYVGQLRPIRKASWHLGYERSWDSKLLTSSMRTEHSEISRRRFAETEPGTVEPISRFFKLAADGISNTLRAGTDSARGAFTSPRPIHFKYQRCVTVREMARLHGFPDWFRFHATKWHGARQIGNSVPPPLARAIAQQFVRAMKITLERPERKLTLGEAKLLRMGMAEASAFWGVKAPIGRRDRKSGARKRKQSQIEMWSALESYA